MSSWRGLSAFRIQYSTSGALNKPLLEVVALDHDLEEVMKLLRNFQSSVLVLAT